MTGAWRVGGGVQVGTRGVHGQSLEASDGVWVGADNVYGGVNAGKLWRRPSVQSKLATHDGHDLGEVEHPKGMEKCEMDIKDDT
jgi:hypothetical protein